MWDVVGWGMCMWECGGSGAFHQLSSCTWNLLKSTVFFGARLKQGVWVGTLTTLPPHSTCAPPTPPAPLLSQATRHGGAFGPRIDTEEVHDVQVEGYR